MKQLRILVKVPTESVRWDIALWRETFGDLALLPAMLDRLETTLAEDLAHLRAAKHPGDAAVHVHRMLGGMRIFGESPEASAAEAWERALRGADAADALSRLPLFEETVQRFLARLRQGVAELPEH